jgi:hypothetical protein
MTAQGGRERCRFLTNDITREVGRGTIILQAITRGRKGEGVISVLVDDRIQWPSQHTFKG